MAPQRRGWCGAWLSIRDWLCHSFAETPSSEPVRGPSGPSSSTFGETLGVVGRGGSNAGEAWEPAGLSLPRLGGGGGVLHLSPPLTSRFKTLDALSGGKGHPPWGPWGGSSGAGHVTTYLWGGLAD